MPKHFNNQHGEGRCLHLHTFIILEGDGGNG